MGVWSDFKLVVESRYRCNALTTPKATHTVQYNQPSQYCTVPSVRKYGSNAVLEVVKSPLSLSRAAIDNFVREGSAACIAGSGVEQQQWLTRLHCCHPAERSQVHCTLRDWVVSRERDMLACGVPLPPLPFANADRYTPLEVATELWLVVYANLGRSTQQWFDGQRDA